MKRKIKISILIASMITLFSCGDNETHVINTVHEDGSVTRKVTVRTTDKEQLEPEQARVPIDSTWQIEITFDLNEKNDTVWLLTADKHFNNVEEINEEYRKDVGSNRDLRRSADFSKSFKWFTTVFRYTETVEKVLTVPCSISDFLNAEELKYAYLPSKVRAGLRNGPDSTSFREMEKSIELKSEHWLYTCEFLQWVDIFYDLFGDHPELKITRGEMNEKVTGFVQQILKDEGEDEGEDEDMDSIFANVVGKEFYTAFETEIDSAVSVLDEMDSPFWKANDYDMEIRMPGRIVASNGYAETVPDSLSGSGILWTVKGDYFLTQTYDMWAESKVNNYLIWIITGIFIVFVASGISIYLRKKYNS